MRCRFLVFRIQRPRQFVGQFRPRVVDAPDRAAQDVMFVVVPFLRPFEGGDEIFRRQCRRDRDDGFDNQMITCPTQP